MYEALSSASNDLLGHQPSQDFTSLNKYVLVLGTEVLVLLVFALAQVDVGHEEGEDLLTSPQRLRLQDGWHWQLLDLSSVAKLRDPHA